MPVPEPSDIQTLKPSISDEYTKAFLQTVNVDVDEYAKCYFAGNTETTITLPKWLDDFAKKENINLSAYTEAYLIKEYNNRHS